MKAAPGLIAAAIDRAATVVLSIGFEMMNRM